MCDLVFCRCFSLVCRLIHVGNTVFYIKHAFVQRHGYGSIEELETALNDAKAKASAARNKLKATESRLNDVNKQIRLTGQFFANKDVYTEYRQCKKSEEFYEKHRAEITLYETARDTLREMSGGQKLPSMKSLKEEKDSLCACEISWFVSPFFNIAVPQQIAKDATQYRKLRMAAFHNKENSTNMLFFIEPHDLPLYIQEAHQRHR